MIITPRVNNFPLGMTAVVSSHRAGALSCTFVNEDSRGPTYRETRFRGQDLPRISRNLIYRRTPWQFPAAGSSTLACKVHQVHGCPDARHCPQIIASVAAVFGIRCPRTVNVGTRGVWVVGGGGRWEGPLRIRSRRQPCNKLMTGKSNGIYGFTIARRT